MIPKVNGTIDKFAARGLFNGLVLLGDYSTNSYWDHITGECVHGELKGAQLEFTDYDLLYTIVSGALKTTPHVQLAVSDNLSLHGRFMNWVSPFAHKILGDRLPPHFVKTVGKADERRTKMDLGLGLWTDHTQRYYPMETLKANPNGILDRVDNRTIFVFYNQDTQAPDAFYIEAQTVKKHDDSYHFDTGIYFSNGQLCSATGEALSVERPQQMFTRWYGFSYTFPKCDIYSADEP